MSRLTYRDPTDACYQKQLRDSFSDLGAPDVDLSLGRAVVRPVTRKLAENIILRYEWLGTLPYGCTHFYGIFFQNFCAGVVAFSVGGGGANVYAYKEFDLSSQYELAYLQRGANVHWSPKGANSKLVSWGCRLLSQETTAKLAIAYADTDAGEIGTIYQSANWIYIGRGSSTRQWVSPEGGIKDQKLASNFAKRVGISRRAACDVLRSQGWTEQESNPKHRYVFILDKRDAALRDLINSKRQNYPKRGTA